MLRDADLTGAELQGADLSFAELLGANLSSAQLQGADLSHALLLAAYLSWAELQGADLRHALLLDANLSSAQLQGADLRGALIWRAQFNGSTWDLADLRGSSAVLPVTVAEIETEIGEEPKGSPYIERLKEVAERLNASLRSAKSPATPDLPEEWRSKPNVMFGPDDPKPEPFDWGPATWTTERAYDEALATFLGDLACASNVPDAQAEGLAFRALGSHNKDRLFARRLAARLIGADCPPAKRFSDDMRRYLEQRAAQGGAAFSMGR